MELLAALADLVLPSPCTGCEAERVPMTFGVCTECATALQALVPFATAPTPPPRGMPPCTAAGPYAGPLRGSLLAYKERGRHRLARPLGALLATAVARAALRGGGGPGMPLIVVPVPSTASAIRDRHGDHMARLATHAVRRLRQNGWQADLCQPLRALPKPDSATLDAPGRLAAAENSLTIRPARIRVLRRRLTMRSTLIVVDDIVTTGATLAAVTTRLTEANMQVTGAATLAATRLRRAPAASAGPARRMSRPGPKVPVSWAPTRGDSRASAG
jgi:predicted amidophosphoribosyltransferase